jgi:Uma2 family endonuclease
MIPKVDDGPPTAPAPFEAEQRFLIHNVSWAQYEALLAAFEDHSGFKATYLKGELELMSPSLLHEKTGRFTARLLDVFCAERGIDIYFYGSTTFKKRAAERGAEPDECFSLREIVEEAELAPPDIALEVVITSGWIDKLDVYRGLDVAEVWFWKQGRFWVYHLGSEGYHQASKSRFLTGLSFEQLAQFVERKDQPQALREYRALLRGAK